MFSTALNTALDLLYPPGCAACDEPAEDAFCVPCRETLVELESPCPRCATPHGGTHCATCALMPLGLDAVRVPYAYGGALADALRHLKFGARTDLGDPLGRLLRPSLEGLAAGLDQPLVVPIPLPRSRLMSRGYNQAALIALGASRRICAERLKRVRETPPQVGLSGVARRTALRGAFAAPPGAFFERDVILVDDVMTTGATLAACAAAVRKAGARRIVGLTVARALA
jgi:ComF family protein